MKNRIAITFVAAIILGSALIARPKVSDRTRFYPDFLQFFRQFEDLDNLASHCLAKEIPVFGCRTENGKLLSLCASNQASAPALSYRFGLPGTVEFQYPKDPIDSLDHFHYKCFSELYECETGAGGTELDYLSFSSGKYQYVLYNENKGCPMKYSSGVRVYQGDSSAGNLLSDIKCLEQVGTLSTWHFSSVVGSHHFENYEYNR